MAIETLLHTERSLAAATRVVLDKLTGAGFETIDGPEDGRLEVDCLDGDTGDEWGFVAPETSPMAAFTEIKAKPTTVRVSVKLAHGQLLLYPGFVVLSRPDADYDEFEDDDRAKQIALREAFELARTFHAREVLLAGDAASDFLGTEATSWEGLKDVLEEEDVPHVVLPVPPKA
ncbi:MAG: hypothetical protein IT460_05820 [Planctomycetes bacterium]|nr:hypothetical protein [Planctomycetota bacterium]